MASAYIEPESDVSNTIPAITRLLQNAGSAFLILGVDCNGAHQEWGCPESNDRGDEVAALAASYALQVCNSGRTPTFEVKRRDALCSSIIDITLASDSLAPRLKDWRVNMDACPSSDHNAIDFTIDTPGLQQPSHRDSTYKYNNKTADWNKFRMALRASIEASGLQDIDFTSPNAPDLDALVQCLTDCTKAACDKTMNLRGNAQPYVPFWTPELESQKKKVIKLHHDVQRQKRLGLPITSAANAHQNAKQEYARSIRKASSSNFRSFCQKQGVEDVWSLTNRLIKDAPTNQPPSTLRLASGFTRTPAETAASLLNHFYPDDTPDAHPKHDELRRKALEESTGEDEVPFTPDEVREALQQMNPNRAPGHDHLTSDIVTCVFEEYPHLITAIMNACLDAGYFPKIWKDARVRILQKPGKEDYADLSSFRPIGLLPVFGKLLEKLLIKRLTYAAQKSDAWNARQFGFREQTSTSDALRLLVTKINEAKTAKRQVIGVSLDIKAAFDNAWWPALLERLRASGCAKNIFRLIQSYLQERNVSLDFANARASKQMTKGCVQGSVCGPTFWNLILDELLGVELPDGCHIQAYADDVMLLVSAPTAAGVQAAANAALKTISEWGVGVKLNFSPAKTQAICFTPASKDITLLIHSQSIPKLPAIKLLGVMLDAQLNFIQHAKYIIQKVTKTFLRLCKFVRPTWGVHPANVETIYRHVIEPTVTYAAGVWGSAAKRPSVQRLLRSFQRSYAIRATPGVPYSLCGVGVCTCTVHAAPSEGTRSL